MKTVILAGGFGTRLSEKTQDIPKPMVEIGGRPILHHIMQIYSDYGHNEFVIALGYKAEIVREYFLHFYSLNNNLTVDLSSGQTIVHHKEQTPWKVHLVDTGLMTQTAGRLKKLQSWIGHERFMMTYGDGVAGIDIDHLIAFHESHGKLATVLAVRPPSRFGELHFDGDLVTQFKEKPITEAGFVNGGFFVLEPEVFGFIGEEDVMWEQTPLQRLAAAGELMGLRHEGFWQPMDTLRDCRLLQNLWESGEAPWTMKGKVYS